MTKPWPAIVAHYEQCTDGEASLQALLALSRHIADSPMASRLYAWTSLWDLCIAQTEVSYPYDGPYLRVSPLFNGHIELRYLDTPEKDGQWHRVVPAGDALARLLKFFNELHWFSGEVA
jgi:hypothetical protein